MDLNTILMDEEYKEIYEDNLYLKNKITNISPKRIKNELLAYYYLNLGIKNHRYFKLIQNCNFAELVNVNNNNNTIEAVFMLKLNNKHITYVSLLFDNGCAYPFKCPKIKIFTHDYLDLLKIDFSFLKKINHEHGCLCCSSVICSFNWKVSFSFSTIFNEIKKYAAIKIRERDHLLCKYVVNHKFGHYLPIDLFL